MLLREAEICRVPTGSSDLRFQLVRTRVKSSAMRILLSISKGSRRRVHSLPISATSGRPVIPVKYSLQLLILRVIPKQAHQRPELDYVLSG